MQRNPIAPITIVTGLWRHRQLILQMINRDVIGRYRGSVMGLAWSLFNPILMLGVYTFVFSEIFKARWAAGASESKIDFAIILFTGLIVHGLFSECVNRSPALILSHVNYVKKVVFPLEILPWMALGSALFHAFINIGVLLAFSLVVKLQIPWTAPLILVVLLPLLLVIMGLSWFLAAIGVYLRDVSQTTGIVTTVLLFISPVFYPISAVPERYHDLFLLNPLTFIIEQARNVLIWGGTPDFAGLAIYALVGAIVAFLGYAWFQKTRNGFADVL